MMLEEKIQREVIRLLDKRDRYYGTALLEELVEWLNKELISPYEITYIKYDGVSSGHWRLTTRWRDGERKSQDITQ